MLSQKFEIEAVVTKPKPNGHRGTAPVLDVATSLGCTIITVSNKQDLDQTFSTQNVTSKLAVLIDFGIIVSQLVIDYFSLGIINSHFSVLPDLRGADPITFAILSGQQQTGVSLMYIVEAMDEGPLLDFATFDLPRSITTPELTKELIHLSHNLLCTAIPEVIAGTAVGKPQTITGRPISYSRKLTKQDGEVDVLSSTATEIERQVRAYIGWPGSHIQLGSINALITEADVVKGKAKPGAITIEKKRLLIGCKEDSLEIKRIKPIGKSEMAISAFLAGYSARISQ